MMQHHLFIQARLQPELPERILRVVRHRGFRVSTLNLDTDCGQGLINLDMVVTSQRAIQLLTTQLTKLPDVDYVSVRLSVPQERRA